MEKELKIVDFCNQEVLDTNSIQNVQWYKDNLNLLIKEAKEKGYIDRFALIRDDDFLPINSMWYEASKNTGIEKNMLGLSLAIRKKYALEKNNIKTSIRGVEVPISPSKLTQALSSVDKNIGSVYMPVRYRSTKHFTINTPLELTGDYNFVDSNRNFTIIDNIDNFINSGYGYSISYHDAYLDVAHEGLKVSDKAIILIENSKYEDLIKNPEVNKALLNKKVIRYIGDEFMAINMILSSMKILPSKVGDVYAKYDNQIQDILEYSIRKLANDNNLLYDKSHSAIYGKGHFSDYYDSKNTEYNIYLEKFVNYLEEKLSKYDLSINESMVTNELYSKSIVNNIDINELLKIIDEYNEQINNEYYENLKEYLLDKEKITPDVSIYFKVINSLIIHYYEEERDNYQYNLQKEIDDYIIEFYQSGNLAKQLLAAQKLALILGKKIENQNINDMNNVERKA
ncbi:MAG: hypothetical protein IJ565_00780 [Bacilli bacterium]|nr:hypothetical protein [Bacilli bacterium]